MGASTSAVNEAVKTVETALSEPQVRAIVQDELATLSKRQKCYLTVGGIAAAAMAALYGLFTHDTFLLAADGAFAAPLLQGFNLFCR